MTIKFSKLAEYKLERLVQYLSQKWSDKASDAFLDQLNSQLQIIQQHPLAFPESDIKPGIRKCKVSKQTLLFYEVGEEAIFVLTLTDARQNPSAILQEIRNHLL